MDFSQPYIHGCGNCAVQKFSLKIAPPFTDTDAMYLRSVLYEKSEILEKSIMF